MEKTTIIQDVTVIPMPGPLILRHRNVVVKDDRIVAVSHAPGLSKTRKGVVGVRMIDGRGKFLLPGFFDMHTHLNSRAFLSLFLMHGVTTIREMGNTRKDIFQLRDKVNSGRILGPRMFIAGPILEGNPPFWKGFWVVNTPREAGAAVTRLKRKGADFIKVYSTLKPDVYEAIVKTAHRLGMKVTGHIPDSLPILRALAINPNGIEHISTIGDRAFKLTWLNSGKVELQENRSALRKILSEIKKNKVAICPTLVVNKKFAQLANYQKLAKDTTAAYLPSFYRETLWNPQHPRSLESIHGKSSLWFRNAGKITDRFTTLIPMIQRHDISILAGSDTANPFVIPGCSLLEELEFLVKAGLKPEQALETATYNAASFLGVLDELGTIEKGKIANFVLLRGNPLTRISHVHKIAGVMLNGRYFSRELLEKRSTLRVK